MPSPALLAVDWGTSALRGALLAADGQVLAEHAAARGLLHIAPGGWAAAFEAEFGPWRQAHPELPCLMAGMVGSRQGWAEAPYCECPAGPPELAAQLHWLQPGRLAIVPGLSTHAGGVPDVMRGEETQVFGALQAQGLSDATLVLPGTHSKWVTVQGGRITGFATHMTGECYALLRQHSILARTLPAHEGESDGGSDGGADDAASNAAFDAGVVQAQQPGGLLHHLFASRTLALFDLMPEAARLSHLSGLVIGEELRAQAAVNAANAANAANASNAVTALDRQRPVLIVGGAGLSARYQRALAALGTAAEPASAQATWLGLMSLARAAKLLPMSAT